MVDENIEQVAETPDTKIVDDTNAAAARLERANAELKATMQQHEAMMVEQTLGGKTEVSGEKKPESDSEYAEKALRGVVND